MLPNKTVEVEDTWLGSHRKLTEAIYTPLVHAVISLLLVISICLSFSTSSSKKEGKHTV